MKEKWHIEFQIRNPIKWIVWNKNAVSNHKLYKWDENLLLHKSDQWATVWNRCQRVSRFCQATNSRLILTVCDASICFYSIRFKCCIPSFLVMIETYSIGYIWLFHCREKINSMLYLPFIVCLFIVQSLIFCMNAHGHKTNASEHGCFIPFHLIAILFLCFIKMRGRKNEEFRSYLSPNYDCWAASWTKS